MAKDPEDEMNFDDLDEFDEAELDYGFKVIDDKKKSDTKRTRGVSELTATQEAQYSTNDEFSVIDSADLITQTPIYTLEEQIELLNKFYREGKLLSKR